MLTATIPAAVVLMIGLPLVLALAITRRLGTPVSLLVWGAGIFVLSQALRLPALQGLTALFDSGVLPAPDAASRIAVNIALLSISAGVFEESARYLAYRTVIPHARSWNAAVTFGAGHGGMESILIGGLMALEFATMLTVGTPGTAPLPGQSPEEHARLADQIARYWATPWYVPLLGALERVFSICFHIAMAVVVLEAVRRRNLTWLVGAIAAHAAANAAATAALVALGPVVAEIVVGLIAALALYAAVRLRRNHADPERPADA
jgi:uncharacterized membrane protein YhfC